MRLHHIAYVCNNIEPKADSLCNILGWKRVCNPVIDRNQGVRILFLKMCDGSLMELLEPLGPDSPVHRFLENGGGLYHLCYEVDNLDEKLQQITKDGEAIVVETPMNAPAIENRRVAFVVTNQQDLIEFVETKKG